LLPKFLQCAQTSTFKIEPRLDVFCKCQKDAQRIFVALQFLHTMTQKSLNLARQLGKY